ncbi:hypothetical protein CMUS01_10545 [Colletotrichum musicola]|uniref:Alpha/beta hydrolase fold-3 domain-containing protein n=1 Tax=Colletotrichum musicola TaxID=2175873 RepID=A0A8H6N8W9_9PEZI|nr:hypothetical protein CMUS01_10545 [Colletotrichum musicola]
MSNFSPNDFSRFSGFHILETTYKVVLDHEIACHVLIPEHLLKEKPEAPRPILFRVHGGGFIAGSSLFPNFFAPWHFELAARHGAVIVSCDYRLVPEASIDELLEDVQDCLKWTQDAFPAFINDKTGIAVDTDRIMVAGDSAGGYLSLYLGLRNASSIRAVAAAYPVVDLESPHFAEKYDKPMLGMPHLPESIVDEHMAKIAAEGKRSIISADKGCARGELMFSFIQNGRFIDIFPPSRTDLSLLKRIQAGERFPRGGVFVWHGRNDTVVPVGGSIKLAETIREHDPELAFELALRDGEHGFDATASIDEDWMRAGMDKLVSAWLA